MVPSTVLQSYTGNASLLNFTGNSHHILKTISLHSRGSNLSIVHLFVLGIYFICFVCFHLLSFGLFAGDHRQDLFQWGRGSGESGRAMPGYVLQGFHMVNYGLLLLKHMLYLRLLNVYLVDLMLTECLPFTKDLFQSKFSPLRVSTLSCFTAVRMPSVWSGSTRRPCFCLGKPFVFFSVSHETWMASLSH